MVKYNLVAPCGDYCGGCGQYNSLIIETAKQMKEFADLYGFEFRSEGAFDFKQFVKGLEWFIKNAKCPGCRQGGSSIDLFNEGCKANDHIIQVAVERGELKPSLVVALDTHEVYRYSKIPIGEKRKRPCSDIRTVIGRQPKDGACYAHEYITLQNIKMKDEPTYVLGFDRVLTLIPAIVAYSLNDSGKNDLKMKRPMPDSVASFNNNVDDEPVAQ